MEYCETVIAGVLPGSKQRMLTAMGRLTSTHFAIDRPRRRLWDLLVWSINTYGDMPTSKMVVDALGKLGDSGEAAQVWMVYQADCMANIPETEFRHGVESLVSEQVRQETGEMFAVGYEILEKGIQIDGRLREGHDEAREYLATKLAQIERQCDVEDAPEGNMLSEAAAIMQRYHETKSVDLSRSVKTGLGSLDKVSGGYQPGDLALIAAFTSHGKSLFCTFEAHHAAIHQGKNVFFGTSETGRDDIINRILARHSREPMFNYPQGLDHAKIRMGELSTAEEKILAQVLEDLAYNPAYGKLEVTQIPRGATLTYLEQRMMAKAHEHGSLDLAICDYLNLLKPPSFRNTQREEASDILKDAKVLATSFGGQGVPFVSPWQVGRIPYEKAKAQQTYDLSALSEASEAEKSASLVLFLMYDKQMSPNKVLVQLLKNRNGATIHKLDVTVDYATSWFAEGGGGSSPALAKPVASYAPSTYAMGSVY